MNALGEGTLGYWGRARGFGIKDILDRRLGGTLYLASGSEAVCARPNDILRESVAGYQLQGTVAVLRIPLA